MLTITGTNLATIKEPKMRAKYGAAKSENVSGQIQTPAHSFFLLTKQKKKKCLDLASEAEQDQYRHTGGSLTLSVEKLIFRL